MMVYMTPIIFALAIFASSTTADGPRGVVVTWSTPRHELSETSIWQLEELIGYAVQTFESQVNHPHHDS
jgi:hypothetical protein